MRKEKREKKGTVEKQGVLSSPGKDVIHIILFSLCCCMPSLGEEYMYVEASLKCPENLFSQPASRYEWRCPPWAQLFLLKLEPFCFLSYEIFFCCFIIWGWWCSVREMPCPIIPFQNNWVTPLAEKPSLLWWLHRRKPDRFLFPAVSGRGVNQFWVGHPEKRAELSEWEKLGESGGSEFQNTILSSSNYSKESGVGSCLLRLILL